MTVRRVAAAADGVDVDGCDADVVGEDWRRSLNASVRWTLAMRPKRRASCFVVCAAPRAA